MASTLVDLVKITAGNSGTGAIKLASAVEGYRGVEALTDAQVYSYAIQQSGAFEVGRGTYLAATRQLSRSVLYSSNGGAAINLQPGAQVSFVVLAEDLDAVSLAAQVSAAQAAAAQSVIDATAQASAAAGQASAATTQATAATTAATNAQTYANAASAAIAAGSILPSNPAALPYVVTAISGGIGTGTGGTNGTYAGGVSGGPAGFAWTYTIAGGALSSYTITNPGISTSNAAPTLSLPSGGLTGVTIPTATVATIPVSRAFWAVTADSAYVALWQNSAGSLAAVINPDTTQVKTPLSGALTAAIAAASTVVTRSNLAQYGTDARVVAVSFRDANGRVLLTGFTDGTLSFKMDWTTLAGLDISARIAAAGFQTVSGLAQVSGGTALGSPLPAAFAQVQRGTANRFAFGVGADGTFVIGKYDTNLALAVTWANSRAGSPEAYPTYIEESGGQIFLAGRIPDAGVRRGGGFQSGSELRRIAIPLPLWRDQLGRHGIRFQRRRHLHRHQHHRDRELTMEPTEERTITDADAKAIASALLKQGSNQIMIATGRGVWALIKPALIAIMLALAIYGLSQSGKTITIQPPAAG